MKKKTKKKKKSRKTKEKKSKVEIKIIKPKESELIEEVKKQEPVQINKVQNLLETKPSTPILERVVQKPEVTLEEEIGFTSKKQEKREIKYDKTLKYDLEAEYLESLKKQREMTSGEISHTPSVSRVNTQKVGRERIIPGQEFHMKPFIEMPESFKEEYDIVSMKKTKKFQGETTAFQEQLERRYDIK